MQKKQLLFLLIFTIFFITVPDAWGKDKKKRRKKQRQKTNKIVKKLKPVPGMFTVTGVVSKTVINEKETYILTSPSGNIVNLPSPKEPKQKSAEDGPELINITDYLDKKVAIFGKGFSHTIKNSPNPKVFIKEIISIRELNNE